MKTFIKILLKQTIVVAMLLSISVSAQEPTDRQIGFDRKTIEKEIAGGKAFISKDFIDLKVNEQRAKMVSTYKQRAANIATNALIPVPVSGCQNMGFEQNTIGWSLYSNTYTYAVPPSQDTGANSALGSQILSNFQNGSIEVVPSSTQDMYLLGAVKPNDSGNVLRLGQRLVDGVGQEEIVKSFNLTETNGTLRYGYAVVQNQPPNDHTRQQQPFFKVTISISGANTLPDCSSLEYYADAALANGFKQFQQTSYYYKLWDTNVINLSQYVDFNINPNPIATIRFSVADCSQGAHESWAYVEAECLFSNSSININNNPCIDDPIGFSAPEVEIFDTDGLEWNIYTADDTDPFATYSGETATHTFPAPGIYRIEFVIQRAGACDFIYTRIINIKDCKNENCEYCASFNPLKENRYIISGWVKEQDPGDPGTQVKTYPNTSIRVSFMDVNQNTIGISDFTPQGDIIDGWQRVQGEFTIPLAIDDLVIDLQNTSEKFTAYFDDIRVFPYNGTMKSYVYDPATHKLMAELDENNYATFYEYDGEGGLVRVKKETSTGIKTIQETRSGNSKKTE